MAEQLDQAMRAADISGRALAKAAAIDKETVVQWRAGKRRNVQVAKVARVAEALGMSVDDLVDAPTTPPTSEQVSAMPANQTQLLRDLAALGPDIEALRAHAKPDLVAMLDAYRAQAEALEQLIPRLLRLADAAARSTD